ncbi:accessory factor UbiK family protein [Defluviicoccus vanus]|uniref:Accessory factor UbiK family protein n=1 Tax=Defluviicoccus vanus TaxID=111831 RepID=A0A7H1N3G8_9PROT|nr:accessory factor UbiK family protein [Defluviicoccus vanus]QNT70254.1 accessory factor UbiK family protein [Defluviicoccus vanus]
MQTRNRLLEDLAKVASGAASTVVGMKEEVDAIVRQRVERLAAELNLVTREEFEATREMVAEAVAAMELMQERLAALEARLSPEVETPPMAEQTTDGPAA